MGKIKKIWLGKRRYQPGQAAFEALISGKNKAFWGPGRAKP
jgi:hypothetical protein